MEFFSYKGIDNYKNMTKSDLDQKYDISSDIVINTADLYCSKFADTFEYSFERGDLEPDKKIKLDILNYIGENGYLADVYNAELCNEDWLIHMYLFKTIHHNFISNPDRNIDSLHITTDGDIFAGLSAIYHFIQSSNILNTWNWLTTIAPTNKTLQKKYKYNYISLLSSNIPTTNNIISIINSVADRSMKINFMTNDILCGIDMHIIYVCLAIKLLSGNGILLTRFYNPREWNAHRINILRLYTLIFQEVYVYSFNIVEPRTYILCKNKKKVPNVKLYKALIYLCECHSDALRTHNLFTKASLDNQWMKKISEVGLTMIDNNKLIDFITDGLKQNNVSFM
jgi:hypothetical protein